MKKILCLLSLLLVTSAAAAQASAADASTISADPFKVEAAPAKGFTYPYYLYVPPELRQASARRERQTILILPNNTGAVDDSFEVHEADVKKRMELGRDVAVALRVAVLMPVFPRPKTDWRIYTHALDRDSMTTGKKEYRRFDLQLIAMINDARARLGKHKLKFDRKVLLNGFSATGMFANRFTLQSSGSTPASNTTSRPRCGRRSGRFWRGIKISPMSLTFWGIETILRAETPRQYCRAPRHTSRCAGSPRFVATTDFRHLFPRSSAYLARAV